MTGGRSVLAWLLGVDLSEKEEKNELGREGRRCEGVLRDGKAFWSFFNASCPADLDRWCLVGPNALLSMPLDSCERPSLTTRSLGPASHGEGIRGGPES